jgi:hypothetical protein
LKRFSKVLVMVFALSGFCAGCAQNTDKTEKNNVRKNRVIVNEFNVMNKGHAMQEAHESLYHDSDALAGLLHYRTMMSLGSEVQLRHHKYTDTCETSARGAGSSTLTSPTRVMTAFHVPIGRDTDHPHFAIFEAKNIDDDADKEGGIWYGNTSGAGTFFITESPFLPNRLFALGLDKWAESHTARRPAVRAHIRHWKFDWDEDFATQGHMVNTGPHWEGNDFAVLELTKGAFWEEEDGPIVWDDKSAASYLPTGSFTMDTPGAFFNIAMPRAYGEEPSECTFFPGITDRIYANMHQWFDITDSQTAAPLSSPGYRSNLIEDGDLKTRCLGKEQTITYKRLNQYEMSPDVRSGSSGGGLFGRPCFAHVDSTGELFWGGPMDHALVHFGVTVAANGPTNSRNWSGTTTSVLPYPDGDPCDSFDYPFQECESGHDTFLDSPNANYFQPLDEHATKWAKRTTDFSGDNDPFDPQPSEPDTDGCPGVWIAGSCYLDINESESSGAGAYPSSGAAEPLLVGEVTNVGDVNSAAQANRNAVDEYESELNEQDIKVAWCQSFGGSPAILTADNEDARYVGAKRGVNMMQGLMGSINDLNTNKGNKYIPPTDNEQARVDALSQICVPWSSTAWTTNWQWSTVNVTTPTNMADAAVFVNEEGIFDNQGWKLLSEVIQYVAEVRRVAIKEAEAGGSDLAEVFFQYRPPSMKNCPPNYYLNGVNYATVSDGEEKYMLGVESLICRAHKPAIDRLGTKIQVQPEPFPLRAASGVYEYTVDLPNHHSSYPYFGGSYYVDFSLDQFIGHPYLDASIKDQAQTKCEDDEVAFAMLLRRNSNGWVNYFKLLCIPAPAQGTPIP